MRFSIYILVIFILYIINTHYTQGDYVHYLAHYNALREMNTYDLDQIYYYSKSLIDSNEIGYWHYIWLISRIDVNFESVRLLSAVVLFVLILETFRNQKGYTYYFPFLLLTNYYYLTYAFTTLRLGLAILVVMLIARLSKRILFPSLLAVFFHLQWAIFFIISFAHAATNKKKIKSIDMLYAVFLIFFVLIYFPADGSLRKLSVYISRDIDLLSYFKVPLFSVYILVLFRKHSDVRWSLFFINIINLLIGPSRVGIVIYTYFMLLWVLKKIPLDYKFYIPMFFASTKGASSFLYNVFKYGSP